MGVMKGRHQAVKPRLSGGLAGPDAREEGFKTLICDLSPVKRCHRPSFVLIFFGPITNNPLDVC